MTNPRLLTRFGPWWMVGGRGYFVILQSLTNRNETAILLAKSGSRAGILKDY